MTKTTRRNFAHVCFSCDLPVSDQRAGELREKASTERRAFLKSDILCDGCGQREETEKAVTVTRAMYR